MSHVKRNSGDLVERMSLEEVNELMTGGLLGKVHTAYKFLEDDLSEMSEQARMTYVKEEVSKSLLSDGLVRENFQLMIIQSFGDGYPLGALSKDIALYVVVIVPKYQQA
jgi:hypothetical protein